MQRVTVRGMLSLSLCVDDSVDGGCVSVMGGASAVRPQCGAPPSHTSPSSPLHTTTSTICKYDSSSPAYAI